MFEIGNTLRETRLRRRLDLMEAEQDTKIRSRYLAALETEEFDVLPGAVYARGFLRTYATYLGLDAQRFLDEYNSRFGRFEDMEDVSQAVWAHATTQRRRRVPSMRLVAILLLIALAGVAWVGLRNEGRRNEGRTRIVHQASAGSVHVGSAFDDRQEPSGLGRADRTRKSGTGDAAANADDAGAVKRSAVASLRLTTSASPSWVEVRRGSVRGPVIWSGTVPARSSRSFTAARMVITIGNPAAVTLQSGRARRSAQQGAASSAGARYLVTPESVVPVGNG